MLTFNNLPNNSNFEYFITSESEGSKGTLFTHGFYSTQQHRGLLCQGVIEDLLLLLGYA